VSEIEELGVRIFRLHQKTTTTGLQAGKATCCFVPLPADPIGIVAGLGRPMASLSVTGSVKSAQCQTNHFGNWARSRTVLADRTSRQAQCIGHGGE